MTTKEKAFILVTQFHNVKPLEDDCNITIYEAKQCALIAVDELIKDNLHNENIVNGGLNAEYWQEVKKEIEKL